MTGQRAIIGLAVIAMMLVSLSPAFAGTANYSYDNVNRLTLLQSGAYNATDYAYDPVGNRQGVMVYPPDISADPTSVGFGSIAEGSSSTAQTVTFSNNGQSPLNIGTAFLNGTDAPEFSIQNDNCSGQSVNPSGDCTVQVKFSPASPGAKSANLSVSSDDPDTPVLDVPLSGTGFARLTVNLGGTGFGNVVSSPSGIDCGNGDHVASDCSEDYVEVTDVTLTASPDAGSAFIGWSGGGCIGTGQCIVTMDATKTVTATFYLVLPDISAAPASHDFGNIGVGSSSITKTFIISNNGTAYLDIGTIDITGTDASEFDKTADACSDMSIAPSEACNVDVKFIPSSAGEKTAMLSVPSNDPDTPTLDVPLSGTATTLVAANDLIVDFGPIYGAFVYYNNSSWAKLHSQSPELMVTGDLDGNGLDDAIVDFGAEGLFVWYNDSTWVKLHNLSPGVLATGDLDGNGWDDAIMDFNNDTWVYYNNDTWVRIDDTRTAEFVAVGDLDGNGWDDLIVDYGADGVWIYYNGSTWSRLHTQSSGVITTGDLDGNGMDDVVLDFTGYGTFIYYNNSTWMKLHGLCTEFIATGDLDESGRDDVILDFGLDGSGNPWGLWVWYNDSTWIKLHGAGTDNDAGMVTGNLDGN